MKYHTDDLNFSLANANDFWKVKQHNEKIPTQRIILPVAFRQYDKSKALLKIHHSSASKQLSSANSNGNGEDSLKKQLSRPSLSEFGAEEVPLKMNRHRNEGFSFANSKQNNIEMSLDHLDRKSDLQKSQEVQSKNDNFTLNNLQTIENKEIDYKEELQSLKEKIKTLSKAEIKPETNSSKNEESPIRKALYINTDLVHHDEFPPNLRRLTSDFGGNIEDMDFDLLNKISGKNNGEEESKKPEGKSASPSKRENKENNPKSVTFKEIKEERNEPIADENGKRRKPPALVKSSSIYKYEYPTLGNDSKSVLFLF